MGKLRKSILVLISIIMALVGAISVQAATAVENTPIPNETVTVTSHISASGILIIVLLLMLIISVAINIWVVKTFFKHKEKFDNLHSRMSTVINQNKALKAKILSLEKNVSFLDSWKQQAILADASIEEKVMATQSRQLAEDFDTKYGDLTSYAISAKDFSIFETACQTYDSLPDTSKYYVSTDMETIRRKCKSSKKLKIKEVTNVLEEALSLYKPTRHYRKNWDKMIQYIKKIPKEINTEVNADLIASVYKNQKLAYGKKWYFPLHRPFCGGGFPFLF